MAHLHALGIASDIVRGCYQLFHQIAKYSTQMQFLQVLASSSRQLLHSVTNVYSAMSQVLTLFSHKCFH
jgi:hypothetical protein